MKQSQRGHSMLALFGWMLLVAAIASAQAVTTRRSGAPVTKQNEAPKQPEASSSAPVTRRKDLRITRRFDGNPCDMIKRDELETILKRSDNDRAFVAVSKPIESPSLIECFYPVRYENRIFPNEKEDNALSILIILDDPNATQGKLVIDLKRDNGPFGSYGDRDLTLEVIKGLGDEAIYARDSSRFRFEDRYRSTAGAPKQQYYLNQDFLYVRKGDLLIRFQLETIVAGNGDPRNLFEIARMAVERIH